MQAGPQRARPVSNLQVTPSPSRPSTRSVTSAAAGSARYCSFSGAWMARRSSALMRPREDADRAQAGLMFWLTWKRFDGSYFFLIWASRS
jgi:hypothetical protein